MIDHVLTCDEVEARGFASTYASGELDAASVARFEEHFLLCASCQEMVRIAVSVRRAEADARADDRATEQRDAQRDAEREADDAANPRRVGFRTRPALIAAAAVFILAAGYLLKSNRDADADLRRLGAVDRAPAYQGLAVRAASSASDSGFVGAMNDYAAGRYESAADRLASAVAHGGGAPALFFRGASLLVLDHASEARDEFTRVIAAGPNPYSVEAHYYRALSELQLGDLDAAIADLRAVPDGDAISDQAHRLLARAEAQRSR